MLVQGIRFARTLSPPVTSCLGSPLRQGSFTLATFRPISKFSAAEAAADSDRTDMEKNDDHEDSSGKDEMRSWFGEKYSTRSNEEGFGGTYGGNQDLEDEEEEEEEEEFGMDEKVEKEDHLGEDFDVTQGNEVVEKEKEKEKEKKARSQEKKARSREKSDDDDA